MLAKLFGRSGRHEAEPTISQSEQFLIQLTLHDEQGRPFYVKFFRDPKGYIFNEKPVLCGDCDKESAIIRAEYYDGIMEPQGSGYFGLIHIPQALQEANVLPKPI